CTNDQQVAIKAVCKTLTGQRRRPAIISADRGRGKSAALGLAAGQLLASHQAQTIFATASSYKQVASIFKHAHAVLPDAAMPANRKCLHHAHGSLNYIAADSLISNKQDCDLLIVDEASTLGIARLEALLKLYPRIAFSGTEHGYEGSGRGFSLKFRQLIQAHCRGQHAVKLHTPVRWAPDDPLEYWTNRLLLLNLNQGESGIAEPVELQALKFRQIAQSKLAENETLLTRIFGLLVDAHYQTRPVDCRYLLDAPNSRLFVAEHGEQIVGLVWLMLEGGLEAGIAHEVVAGRRRPQGHLVPQILAAHLGLEEAITLRCARIQRIVVDPLLQGRGIGSWMLEKIAKQDDINADYLASSFGADPPLSSFWQRAGYRTARISDKPQAASGLHSVVVLKPCSDAANSPGLQTPKLFRTQFVTQLASGLRNLSSELACSIAPQGIDKLNLDSDELKTAVLFAYAQRPYESSLAVLAKLGQYALFNPDPGFEPGRLTRHLFIKRTLQNQPWSACAEELNINGQRECVKHLRHGTRAILAHAFSEEIIAKLRTRYHC
ncbi:MAG: tRNA(Met) cytidine acetyltransferase, partial [Proteobacteria bacterium]|nr:tRNA(Met) cytidine acetyltransferase [Pseudomonadota bacterium]